MWIRNVNFFLVLYLLQSIFKTWVIQKRMYKYISSEKFVSVHHPYTRHVWMSSHIRFISKKKDDTILLYWQKTYFYVQFRIPHLWNLPFVESLFLIPSKFLHIVKYYLGTWKFKCTLLCKCRIERSFPCPKYIFSSFQNLGGYITVSVMKIIFVYYEEFHNRCTVS